jgi:threonine/homoserine/homoserine lactone efflux protein
MSLLTFIPAALVVIVAPGPDTIYTLTQSIRGGKAAGTAAGLGTATGVMIHTAAAILGLSALLQTSAFAYKVVKYIGAFYLIYLGIQIFREDEGFELEANFMNENCSLLRIYKKATVVNVSNPKVAVFVLAFFPQFVPRSANAVLQMSILGILYASLSLIYLTGIAFFAVRVRRILSDSRYIKRLIHYASGTVLIGFGVKLALEKHRIS